MKKLILILMAALPVLTAAQPGMPNNPTPVDGLIGLLAAAGVTYGIREYQRRNRQK
ncbi:MAG: PID-CTERM protein-sorting domain-containing protein [Thermaurantimonas sp.]